MGISLVIPGRDVAATLDACLAAASQQLGKDGLREILYVDDGSRDGSAEIARRYPVRVLSGGPGGPGAARNRGWRQAREDLVWFVDADCVVEPDALALLAPHLADPRLAGAGGSYGNMRPGSLLARLVHEEIRTRHLAMPGRVRFLATFNVLYRRAALEAVGGFDESLLKAQDADLAYRLCEAGWGLAFEARSRVRHFHPDRLGPYLGTQCRQGYWRARLYRLHPRAMTGDGYSDWLDHLQPPLALAVLAALPVAALPGLRPWALLPVTGLAALQLPMTWRLLRRCRRPELAAFALLGFVRAFARGAGLAAGILGAARPPEAPKTA